jgi:hypothetical protein
MPADEWIKMGALLDFWSGGYVVYFKPSREKDKEVSHVLLLYPMLFIQ